MEQEYFVVYSEYSGDWEVRDELPADTAGRGYAKFRDYGRAELEASYRNAEKSLYD